MTISCSGVNLSKSLCRQWHTPDLDDCQKHWALMALCALQRHILIIKRMQFTFFDHCMTQTKILMNKTRSPFLLRPARTPFQRNSCTYIFCMAFFFQVFIFASVYCHMADWWKIALTFTLERQINSQVLSTAVYYCDRMRTTLVVHVRFYEIETTKVFITHIWHHVENSHLLNSTLPFLALAFSVG